MNGRNCAAGGWGEERNAGNEGELPPRRCLPRQVIRTFSRDIQRGVFRRSGEVRVGVDQIMSAGCSCAADRDARSSCSNGRSGIIQGTLSRSRLPRGRHAVGLISSGRIRWLPVADLRRGPACKVGAVNALSRVGPWQTILRHLRTLRIVRGAGGAAQ